MRSHPSCWNKTLAQLGFKRKRRKVTRKQDLFRRRSIFQVLEERQMLSGDPLFDLSSDAIVVTAPSTEGPIKLTPLGPQYVLFQPEMSEADRLAIPKDEREAIEPVFIVDTVQTTDGPKAIISLNPNNLIGPSSALQELRLELQQSGRDDRDLRDSHRHCRGEFS